MQVAVVESYTTDGDTTILPNLQRREEAVKPVPDTVTGVPPLVEPAEGEIEDIVVTVEKVYRADVVEVDTSCPFVETVREYTEGREARVLHFRTVGDTNVAGVEPTAVEGLELRAK